MKLPLVWSPKYNTELARFGIDKPFALDRGQMVLERLSRDFELPMLELQEGETTDVPSINYEIPKSISNEDLLLVHDPAYLKRLKNDDEWLGIFEFSPEEYKPESAELPLHEIIHDFTFKSGGTKRAAELCLETGLAATLGGGYHHAFPDRGQGFCSIHDIAIAIRSLQKQGRIKKALIVDLDFHQGDGSAVIFKNDDSVFTMSVHSEEGWPEVKQESDLDIPVKQKDAHLYLEYVQKGVQEALKRFAPDMVMYVAGSDPYEKDVLPGTKYLRLPLDILKQRDFYVIDMFKDKGIPLSSVFAGGYGPHVWEVHYWATRRLLERTGNLVKPTVSLT